MGSLEQIGKAAGVIVFPIAVIIAVTAVAGRRAGALAVFALFGLVGIALLLAGAGRIRAWLRLRGSSAAGPDRVDPGPTEVAGTARPLEETVEPPRADDETESLVYEHIVKKKRRETDEDGTREYWEATTNDTVTVPFVVEGGNDAVVVDPAGADLLLEDSFSERDSARREYVRRLDPGEAVYVAGEAVHTTEVDGNTDGRQYVIKRPETRVPELLRRVYDQPFVLSDSSEDDAERRLLWNGVKASGLALFYNAIYVGLLVALLGGF
ncbi:hypothetical protein [Halorientalis sp.]|jgi:hypothetical protein|uniref:hypothetical protein n=1 Tax=Halorientalis sp. TaxID=1931229 RepID=UPI002624C2F6|nr:hypothetical protein [Halorientalis sp.]